MAILYKVGTTRMYRFLGSIHGENTVENIRSNFAYKIAHNLRLCTTTIYSVVVLHFGLSYCISLPYREWTSMVLSRRRCKALEVRVGAQETDVDTHGVRKTTTSSGRRLAVEVPELSSRYYHMI